MIDFMTAFIYGIIQGVTEFLPISSSGHLAILPKIMKFEDPGVFFDLAMHVGTAVAVFVYYFKQIKTLFTALLKPSSDPENFHFANNMIISTIFSVIFVFVLKGIAEDIGRQLISISLCLIFFGILMAISDRFGKVKTSMNLLDQRNFLGAAIIGLSQSLAIFPGVSRSGITLTAARFMGLSREQGTQYSFLLSIPIIIGGFLYKLKEIDSGANFDLSVMLFGMVLSFIVGLLTIHFFLKFIRKFGLLAFAIYRVILGGVLFLL